MIDNEFAVSSPRSIFINHYRPVSFAKQDYYHNQLKGESCKGRQVYSGGKLQKPKQTQNDSHYYRVSEPCHVANMNCNIWTNKI